MNLLTADNISKAFTGRRLLDEASFYLQEGEKVGIIGINGTGKSTLLKIMAGLVEPDSGQVIMANHVVMRYLPQNPVFQPEVSVLQSVLEAAAGKQDTIIAGGKRQDSHAVNEKIWNMESKAKSLLLELGITDFEQKTGELSGGQRKRLALAAILLVPCDILLLDEPTNHIDHEMADWLENYLKKWKGSLVMVTHDRYFLDSVVNRIVEIDKGHIYSYDTNYSGFLERKALREENELAGERKRQSILRKELEWIKRGARARSTKQKARIERFETLRDREAPTEDKKLELSSISTRMGRTTVELDHVSKAYGNRVLIKDFSYIFLKQDRIGFIGENGSGKTTLMKIIEGRLQPDSGEVIVGQTIKIGYYSQEIEEEENAGIAYMDPSMRVIDYIKNTAEYVRTKDGLVSASAMLERFLFPPEEQYGLIGKLSGGEKRRLNLLRVLMEAPNVLILDEPTNDLDIVTLSILEDYLDAYEGIVITVSHDRYFLDRIVRRIFAFEGEGVIRQYEGGYTDYVNRRKAEESKEPSDAVATKNMQNSKVEESQKKGKPRNSAPKLKFSYKEEREYETIEDDIAALEEKADKLEQEIIKCATDFVRLNELSKEKEEVDTALLEKMERWEYLEELAAKIKAQNS
ncbi:MAG: ABC-F family ATP-binding cassette domain-containing protein [Lachnospiraceae bacterium]|nr:ABC-F family ATP-binding cassette domain-containing protein [Lachnospiraceae bacterium]